MTARDLACALTVDLREWTAETRSIDEWFTSIGRDELPVRLHAELIALTGRLSDGSRR